MDSLTLLRLYKVKIFHQKNIFVVATRSFSSLAAEKSKRRIFRELNANPSVLNHLDKLNLGYVARKRAKIAISAKRSESLIDSSNSDVPFPFRKGPKAAKLEYEVSDISQIPESDIPEVAIIGRSNVGKSTLMNALIGFQSHLTESKVSCRPGQTRKLYFYSLGGSKTHPSPALTIVDMPGFGFAFMSPQDQERCHQLTMHFLKVPRPNLKRVLLILDARHGFKLADIQFLEQLFDDNYSPTSPSLPDPHSISEDEEKEEKEGDATQGCAPTPLGGNSTEAGRRDRDGSHLRQGRPTWKLQIILTKCDLVERSVLARQLAVVRRKLSDGPDRIGASVSHSPLSSMQVLPVSGLQRRGVMELQRELGALVPSRTRPLPVSAPTAAASVRKRVEKSEGKQSSSTSSSARGGREREREEERRREKEQKKEMYKSRYSNRDDSSRGRSVSGNSSSSSGRGSRVGIRESSRGKREEDTRSSSESRNRINSNSNSNSSRYIRGSSRGNNRGSSPSRGSKGRNVKTGR